MKEHVRKGHEFGFGHGKKYLQAQALGATGNVVAEALRMTGTPRKLEGSGEAWAECPSMRQTSDEPLRKKKG